MAITWNIPNFSPSADPEIRQLQEFVFELELIIEDIVRYPQPAIAGRHHTRLYKAWDHATEESPAGDNRFSRLIRNLDGSAEISRENVQEVLNNVGLTSAPLELKLGTFHHARDEYLDYGTSEGLMTYDEQKSRWPGWRKVFGRVLQAAGIILGSTASQIPGGEYIKEFVENVYLLTEMRGDIED